MQTDISIKRFDKAAKTCEFCGGIIGSKSYKIIPAKKKFNQRKFYHLFCNKIMKLYGLISISCHKCKNKMKVIREKKANNLILFMYCPICGTREAL